MFGDNFIIGHTSGKIDEKGRIKLPAFTNAEENDKLVIRKIKTNSEVILKLHIYNKYADILNRFKVLRDNATSIEEFNKYDKEIERICSILLYVTHIDKQRRVQLPKQFMIENNWNNGEIIEFEGLGSSLLVRKQNK